MLSYQTKGHGSKTSSGIFNKTKEEEIFFRGLATGCNPDWSIVMANYVCMYIEFETTANSTKIKCNNASPKKITIFYIFRGWLIVSYCSENVVGQLVTVNAELYMAMFTNLFYDLFGNRFLAKTLIVKKIAMKNCLKNQLLGVNFKL